MRRRELLASTTTPDGMRMTLSLLADHYYIDVDGQGLMSSRAPGSEKALANLAAEALGDRIEPRVLIGGLGLGFTLGGGTRRTASWGLGGGGRVLRDNRRLES